MMLNQRAPLATDREERLTTRGTWLTEWSLMCLHVETILAFTMTYESVLHDTRVLNSQFEVALTRWAR